LFIDFVFAKFYLFESHGHEIKLGPRDNESQGIVHEQLLRVLPIAICVAIIDERGHQPAVVLEGPSPPGRTWIARDLIAWIAWIAILYTGNTGIVIIVHTNVV
jgi:hypothetical protein